MPPTVRGRTIFSKFGPRPPPVGFTVRAPPSADTLAYSAIGPKCYGAEQGSGWPKAVWSEQVAAFPTQAGRSLIIVPCRNPSQRFLERHLDRGDDFEDLFVGFGRQGEGEDSAAVREMCIELFAGDLNGGARRVSHMRKALHGTRDASALWHKTRVPIEDFKWFKQALSDIDISDEGGGRRISRRTATNGLP